MNWIKEWLIKKVLLNGILRKLDRWFSKLPQNDAKMITGILIAIFGILLQELPHTSEYIQPILDYLKTLPADEITGGGIGWAIVGGFHKIVKWLKSLLAVKVLKEPELPEQPKIVAVVVEKEDGK